MNTDEYLPRRVCMNHNTAPSNSHTLSTTQRTVKGGTNSVYGTMPSLCPANVVLSETS